MKKIILLPILFILLINCVLAVDHINEYHDRTSLGNHIYNSILYSVPMNYPYQDGDSISYLPINNNIVVSDRDNFSYEIESGVYNAYFKEPSNTTDLILLENKNKITNSSGSYINIYDNESIQITPILMQYYNGTDTELISIIDDVNGTIQDNYINYTNAYTTENDVVDMQFVYSNDFLKEYLYLKNNNFTNTTLTGEVYLEFKNTIKIDLDVFDVYADPDGDNVLTLQTGDFIDGRVEFRRKSDNVTLWQMPKPKSWDNESEIDSHYRFVRGNNEFNVSVQTNNTWISDSARNYPIIIDPTTDLTTARGLISQDAHVREAVPTGSDAGTLYTQSKQSENKRSYIGVDFSSIGSVSITNATLFLKVYQYTSLSANVDVESYYCNDSFTDTTLTWNNQATEVTNCASTPFHSQASNTYANTNWHQFDMLEEAQYESGEDQIFSIKQMMNPEDYDSQERVVRWAGTKISGSEPYFNMTYSANNAPTIPYVNAPSSANPTEASNTTIYVVFNATDLDNYTDIDVSTAQVQLTKGGETTITSDSCSNTTDGVNTTTFNCTVKMPFYAGDGSWTITASVDDMNSATATNNSLSLTYGALSAMTVDISAIGWGDNITLNTNDSASNDTTILTNTGNQAFTNITIKGQAFIGQAVPTYWVNSTQFEAVTSNTANAGTSLQDNVYVQITGATLPKGSSSTEELWYFGDFPLSLGITPQHYKTNTAWNIKVST